MNNQITFSIIIPFFNESKKLLSVINNLKLLDWDSQDYEVILVDNMSTDSSYEIALSQTENIKNYRVLQCTSFKSSYAARNTGWQNAKGEYIVFIDADCIANKNLLREYFKSIQSDSAGKVGVFAGSIVPYERDSLTTVEKYSEDKKLLNQASAVNGWAYRPFAQTANAAIRRDILEEVNGFNPHMTSGGDGEICWRITDITGKNIMYCEAAKVSHWHRESLRDLFFQFEKYGIGRFQQNALIPEFNKGLIGVSKESILEGLLILENEIIENTKKDLQKSLLWKLYDITAQIANSIGYLGAKSIISNPPGKNNIFEKPVFNSYCSACKLPNLDKVPTLSVKIEPQNDSTKCSFCKSTLEERALTFLGKNPKENKLINIDIRTVCQSTNTELTKVIFIAKNPTEVSDVIFITRWALENNLTLLFINERNEKSIASPPSSLQSIEKINKAEIFYDTLSGKNFILSLIP